MGYTMTESQDVFFLHKTLSIQNPGLTLELNSIYDNNSIESIPYLIQAEDDNFSTKISDMQYWIVSAFILIFVRIFVEKYIFTPIGVRLGIKSRYPTTKYLMCGGDDGKSPLKKLEATYSSVKNKKLSESQIQILSTQINLGTREIERWLRKRRRIDKPSTLTKFSESGWRLVCYIASTIIGGYAVWDSPCLRSATECWEGYPNHGVSDREWWYYTYGAGLYLSFLITQAFDVKRKDFREMCVHHVITLTLLVFTWTGSMTRATFVVLLHDCADIFIEGAKMANYAKRDKLATVIFMVFSGVWTISRLIIYPVYVVWGHGEKIVEHLQPQIAYPIVTLLGMLFGLHLFWSYFIAKVIIKKITCNKTGDSRSSSEESESTTEDELDEKQMGNDVKYEITHNMRKFIQKRFSLPNDDDNGCMIRHREFLKRISVEIM